MEGTIYTLERQGVYVQAAGHWQNGLTAVAADDRIFYYNEAEDVWVDEQGDVWHDTGQSA